MANKAVNRHGLKIKNLRYASGQTCNESRCFTQIDYDTATGELLTAFHAGDPSNTWTEYHDPNVIRVACTSKHLTMQQIADLVRDAVKEIRDI